MKIAWWRRKVKRKKKKGRFERVEFDSEMAPLARFSGSREGKNAEENLAE